MRLRYTSYYMKTLEDLVTFAKRRGFIFPSSEIYGGFAGVYDYGPLGVELLNNLKKSWWKEMVQMREDVFGIDTGIMTHPKVWEASGHTTGFTDPVVTCKKTGKKFRADQLLEAIGVEADDKMSLEDLKNLFAENIHKVKAGNCNSSDLTEPSLENLLVSAEVGGDTVYLRGETCQGIYINFKQVVDTMHPSLPFGIAQIGKAFRNEISPRQFLFRTREFEQMEMQYFVYEKDANTFFETFRDLRMRYLESLGIKKKHLRVVPHKHLVFYARAADDIEYEFPFGWRELEGIHNRGDYDLTQHSQHSGKKLTYFDQDQGEHITPHVIETSIGLGRLFLAVLADAYTNEAVGDDSERVVLQLKPALSPMKVAILPLVKRGELEEIAKNIYQTLSAHMPVYVDMTGSIGKRYRRADEIGTPLAVTIDEETVEKGTVTIRNRDTMKQEKIMIAEVLQYTTDFLGGTV